MKNLGVVLLVAGLVVVVGWFLLRRGSSGSVLGVGGRSAGQGSQGDIISNSLNGLFGLVPSVTGNIYVDSAAATVTVPTKVVVDAGKATWDATLGKIF